MAWRSHATADGWWSAVATSAKTEVAAVVAGADAAAVKAARGAAAARKGDAPVAVGGTRGRRSRADSNWGRRCDNESVDDDGKSDGDHEDDDTAVRADAGCRAAVATAASPHHNEARRMAAGGVSPKEIEL